LGSYRFLPCLPGSRRSLRVAVLIVGLAVAVLAPEINAQSPASHPHASGPAVQTIDVASLSSVLDLDGPWRFHAGDDPHFADPALDDSAWPSIRPNQPFQAVGIPSLPAGYLWTRIHLHVPTAAGPLALAVYPYFSVQYEIFVNGSRIASTPGMATRTLRLVPSFPVALPPSGDIVLAIRFYCGSVYPLQSLPLTRVSLGSLGTIRIVTELDHLRAFNNGLLAAYACLCVSLLIAITAMILYRLQRDHDEYLSFANSWRPSYRSAAATHSAPGSWIAVPSSPEPSMPTPTMPKRMRSLAATGGAAARDGSESRKTGPPIKEAPAAPADACRNARRDNGALFIV